MNDNTADGRFTLDVQPGTKPSTFGWAIRRDGKLIERSDRIHRTEDDARRSGQQVMERHYAGGTPTPTFR